MAEPEEEDAAPGAPAPAEEPAEGEPAPPEDRVALLAAELAAEKDRFLRALAEAENARRRALRERDEQAKFAVAGFARELLAVADNLRRALASIPPAALEADEALRNLAAGVELTERLLSNVFERYDIRRLEPVGEKFDSHLHQAMMVVPAEGQAPGTVVEVMQAGYLLGDRLLRPALVSVAGEAPAAPDDAAGGDTGSPGGRVDTSA